MIGGVDLNKNALPWLLALVLLLAGCGVAASYRPADKKTIRDFSDSGDYRKKVGVLALANTTIFTSEQVTAPFMDAFLAGMVATAPDATLVLPDHADGEPFLWNPPRTGDGDMDVYALGELARQEGMHAVVSPVLMDVRVRKRKTGFWFFRDVAYTLQIQTAAAIYDAITGARLALGILTDEIDIDEYQSEAVGKGQEVQVDDLVEVAEEMGEKLGQRMGDAIIESKWQASVTAIADGACVLAAGSEAGIEAGDRFAVLDGSARLTGLDGQRFIVPGVRIGNLTISRVMPQMSYATSESGALPPVGSILIPEF